MSRQLIFHATKTDILPVLGDLEKRLKLKYVLVGLFEQKEPTVCFSLAIRTGLGVSQHGDWNKDEMLMALPIESPIMVREVPQRRGGLRYAYDLKPHACSVSIQLGGYYQGEAIVAGRIGVTSNDKCALDLYLIFKELFKKMMLNIEGTFIGSEALDFARHGGRLVTNVRMDKAYDLVLKS